jgi:hypothetical protein
VLYVRSFERGIDDEVLAMYLHGDWWIQAASQLRHLRAVVAAYEGAVALMWDADARRRTSH